MVSKSIIYLVKSFLGNFCGHLAIFSGRTGCECDYFSMMSASSRMSVVRVVASETENLIWAKLAFDHGCRNAAEVTRTARVAAGVVVAIVVADADFVVARTVDAGDAVKAVGAVDSQEGVVVVVVVDRADAVLENRWRSNLFVFRFVNVASMMHVLKIFLDYIFTRKK